MTRSECCFIVRGIPRGQIFGEISLIWEIPVKITTFLTDINNYAAYSKVRSEAFPTSPPASSTVIVAGLVRPEFLVEIEAVEHIP